MSPIATRWNRCSRGSINIVCVTRAYAVCVYRRGDFLAPDRLDGSYQLTDEKVMVNVGSVGASHNDPRACYVVPDDTAHDRGRRVKYDNEKTRRKIYEIDDLDNVLGDRLLPGRGSSGAFKVSGGR
ncbi:MAG: hypothetical protein R3B96_15295 [Pirellulaceae bacterium]